LARRIYRLRDPRLLRPLFRVGAPFMSFILKKWVFNWARCDAPAIAIEPS
jgi:hypothetical protein